MSKEQYQYEKRRNRSRLILALLISIILFIILLLTLILLIMDTDEKITPSGQTSAVTGTAQNNLSEAVTEKGTASQPETEETESIMAELTDTEPETDTQPDEQHHIKDAASFASLKETDIYTFLQGPKAWNSKTDWSGMWHKEVRGYVSY